MNNHTLIGPANALMQAMNFARWGRRSVGNGSNQ